MSVSPGTKMLQRRKGIIENQLDGVFAESAGSLFAQVARFKDVCFRPFQFSELQIARNLTSPGTRKDVGGEPQIIS